MDSSSRTTDEFLAGDGLRALAALSVLVFHTTELVVRKQFGGNYFAAFSPVPARFLMTLNDGLYIFFALSGYLLTRGFARSLVEGRKRPSIKRYGISRVLRIVPAFWLAVTVTLLLRGTVGAGVGHIAALYGFAQVYALHPVNVQIVQAWTLDIEAGFYIILPLLAVAAVPLVRRLPTPVARVRLLLAALAVIAMASWAFDVSQHPNPLNANPLEFFFAFVPGMALALVEPLFSGNVRARTARIGVPSLLAVAGALFVVSGTMPQLALDRRAGVAALAAGCLVGAALMRQWCDGRSWRVFDNRVSRWLGVRSYGIYLFHWLVMLEVAGLATHGRLRAMGLLTGVTLVLTVIAAAISWRFVEEPALRLRRRVASRTPVPELPAQPAGISA